MMTISALNGSDALSDFTCPPDWRSAAILIDSTLLRSDVTRSDIERACRDAAFYGFAALFVHPTAVAQSVVELRGTSVKVGAPVGYSSGASLSTVKRFEAEELLRLGAQELDVVINVGALKSGERALVQADLEAVVAAAHGAGAICRVIIEAPLLDIHEKILACELSLAAGADFVKTSTGTVPNGAIPDDVALIRGVVGTRARIKASGGIRTAAQMTQMLSAGADRIGTSVAVEILRELGAPSQ